MFNKNVFDIKNAMGDNTLIMNESITKPISSPYVEEINSILEDTKVIGKYSSDLYRGLDSSNNDITTTSEEFYDFYNNVNSTVREMCNALVNNTEAKMRELNNTMDRSSANIQKWLDHINKKPDNYIYNAVSFQYTFDEDRPIISDIVEIGKDVEVDMNTDISNRHANHITRISKPEHMNLVRGSIAGMYGTEIPTEDFRNTLYTSFRNGQTDALSVAFSKKNLVNSCSFLLSYIGETEDMINTAERISSSTIKVLDIIDGLNRSGFINDINEDEIGILYSYLYNKLIELVEVFMMVRIAFTVQLEAFIEMYMSRLDIIRTHYNSGGIVNPPSSLNESINELFFLAEMELESSKINRHIAEASALSLEDISHATNSLRIVNEDFVERSKAALGRLMNRIKNLWDKFMESVNNLIKSDKKYLEKYKKVILERNMQDATYEMYDFPKGLRVMQNATVPRFNYPTLKESLASEDKFIQTHFRKYTRNDMKFTDSCKLIFRGSDEKKRIKSRDLDIKDMYDFCINFQKMADSIKKDMDEIEKAGNDAIKIIDAVDVNTESVVYSSLRESVLYEDKDTSPRIKKTDDDTERSADGQARKNNDENKSSDVDRVMTYMKVTQNFLGSKMGVLQEIYKGYMFIIREHVKSYTGTRSTKKPSKTVDGSMKNVADEDTKGAKSNFLS